MATAEKHWVTAEDEFWSPLCGTGAEVGCRAGVTIAEPSFTSTNGQEQRQTKAFKDFFSRIAAPFPSPDRWMWLLKGEDLGAAETALLTPAVSQG